MIEQPEVKIKQAREVKRVSQDFVAAQLGISTRARRRHRPASSRNSPNHSAMEYR